MTSSTSACRWTFKLSVQIAANSTQDGELAQCVSTVVRRMAFPAADGVTGATYPFLFETTDSDD